jgi:glyoxylase-like metal-dependent hydrolase (beta-lactamase superfamily II)
VLVVDAGETPRVAEPGYFACDPGTRLVYERLLRFDVPPAAALGAQLTGLGIPPDAVRWVALTHLHSDHAGGLGDLTPGADYLGRAGRAGGVAPRRGGVPVAGVVPPHPGRRRAGARGAVRGELGP